MQPEHLAHYRILRPLGSGGMGEVFLAEDTRLHRKVALKVLRHEQADGDAGRKRLLREAQSAAQLDHPNACSIYEVGDSELGTYIAMQFIEGESLSDLMVRQQVDLGALLDIGIQVADALAEAHAQGLVHRDIKPQNIMVTAKGQAKVLDFGLAKRITPMPVGETGTILTHPGLVLGTVPYMSPEQVKGEELDGRSDVFSLGTVLFEVATGRRPFEAHSGVELMALILSHDPFDAADPAVPLNPEFRRILERALAKDQPKRYQSARELREDLQRLRALLPATGRPGDLGTQTTTQIRARLSGGSALGARPRRKAVALGLSAALLAGCAVSAFLWLKPSPSVASIAVLPITNESGDASADYVSDGLTENLIQQLSHLQGLKVIARSSILRYKGRNADPATVGRELGVQTVLVGHMRTRDGQLFLNLELADAREQSRLWGTQLQRPTSDLVAIQDDLAHELSRHLGRPSQTADLQSLDQARVKTSSAQAYDLYLKGRFYADRMVPTEVERALGYFDQALALDPGFALARVGKANAYWNMSSTFRAAGEMMP
ncbi:MAG TPA: serine/threonine-protein kinase, partial [Geothrix sp.]|nr:serine/threonine-protein kinase [Geothrix sp.]